MRHLIAVAQIIRHRPRERAAEPAPIPVQIVADQPHLPRERRDWIEPGEPLAAELRIPEHLLERGRHPHDMFRIDEAVRLEGHGLINRLVGGEGERGPYDCAGTASAAGPLLEMRWLAREIKVLLHDREALAAPQNLALTLELLQADVDAPIGQLLQGPFDTFACHQVAQVTRLAAGGTQQAKVGATTVAIDRPLYHRE